MIEIVWLILTRVASELLIPFICIYIVFDLLGTLLFNKR